MLNFILKHFEVIFKILKIFIKNKKNIFLLFLYLIVCYCISTFNFYILEKKNYLPSINLTRREDNIILSIDEVLKQLGEDSFISWIIVEETNNDFLFYFKDLRGIISADNIPISIKYFNSIYLNKFELDRNSKDLIKKIQEFEVKTITKQNCIDYGYTTLYHIFNRSNTKIHKIKLAIVKKNKRTIWIFTLSTKSNKLSLELQNNNLRAIAMQAKNEILYN